jgi:hypothetical protein
MAKRLAGCRIAGRKQSIGHAFEVKRNRGKALTYEAIDVV